MTPCAEVALSLPIYSTFTYKIPPEFQTVVKPGMAVVVPFRGRKISGVVVELRVRPVKKNIRLKNIEEVIYPEFYLSQNFLSFTYRLAEDYFLPWGEILTSAFPRLLTRVHQKRVKLTEEGRNLLEKKTARLNSKERKILNFIGNKNYTLTYLKRKIKERDVITIISRLEKKKLVEISVSKLNIPSCRPDFPSPPGAQLEIPFGYDDNIVSSLKRILDGIKESKFCQFYLHGTDEWRQVIYFALIEKVIEAGGQTLLLVPEILSSSPLVAQMVRRWGEKVVFYHSRLTPRSLWSAWREVVAGKVKIVVGTRSALFLPLPLLKLIIVDNEADASYYQLETPRYDSREGAFLRAKEENICLVWGSPTPRIETYFKCSSPEVVIQEKNSASPGKIIIDEFSSSNQLFSNRLKKKLQNAFVQGRQFLLFFNRLGRSAMYFCPRCQQVMHCPECGGRLTRSSRGKKIVCSSGHTFPAPLRQCFQCGVPLIEYKGWGIDQVAQELQSLLPGIKIGIVSSETIRTKASLTTVLTRFKKQKIQALIGTEMLLHQSPPNLLELVVALRPEITLGLPDFEAAQKMYQSLAKLRRYLVPGQKSEFWIQTALPDHHVFQSLLKEDYQCFYNKEISYRQAMKLPPFFKVVQVFFSGRNMSRLGQEMRALLNFLKKLKGLEWRGPRLTYHPQNQRVKGIQLLLKIPFSEKENFSQLKKYFLTRKFSPWVKIQG